MELNLFKTCRSCLRSGPKLRNLFKTYIEEDLKLSACYEMCCNLDISEDDKLPKMICIMCESNLRTAFHFRKQCIEAVELFLPNSKKDVQLIKPPLIVNAPFVIKQELNASCEFETEGEDETVINTIAVDKIEQQEYCTVPESHGKTENLNAVDASAIELPSPNVETKIPILKESRYFQCPKCQKAFISYRHLEIHLKSHKKDPYICEICNRKCPSKSVLKIHQKKHRGEAVEKEIPNNTTKDMFVVEYLYGFRPE